MGDYLHVQTSHRAPRLPCSLFFGTSSGINYINDPTVLPAGCRDHPTRGKAGIRPWRSSWLQWAVASGYHCRHRAVVHTGWGLGGDPCGFWGWTIQTIAMNTGEVFVIPEEAALGGVLQPERGERSLPRLQSVVLGVFNPNQQTEFLRIGYQGSALERMFIKALLKHRCNR